MLAGIPVLEPIAPADGKPLDGLARLAHAQIVEARRI